jgi:hypothetical protein
MLPVGCGVRGVCVWAVVCVVCVCLAVGFVSQVGECLPALQAGEQEPLAELRNVAGPGAGHASVCLTHTHLCVLSTHSGRDWECPQHF